MALRWSDVDANRHMNNVAILRLLEESRIRTLWDNPWVNGMLMPREHAGESESRDLDVALLGNDTGTVIARQEIEYLEAMPYFRDPVDIEMWIGRIGSTSIDVCFHVRGPRADPDLTTYARAQCTLVLLDAIKRSPRKITAEERRAWSKILEEPVRFSRRPRA